MDPLYEIVIWLCKKSILNLCSNYGVDETVTIQALMIANTFISTNTPDGHLKPTTKFDYFWTFVGVVCFALAVNFHEGVVKLADMLPIVGIRHLEPESKYYKYLQSHILTAIEWRLFYSTG